MKELSQMLILLYGRRLIITFIGTFCEPPMAPLLFSFHNSILLVCIVLYSSGLHSPPLLLYLALRGFRDEMGLKQIIFEIT